MRFAAWDLRPWHKWFAWHPVRLDWYTWAWLEYVERAKGIDGWVYR